MLEFKLDPPSAHSNSYQDIKFIIKFDECDTAKISLLNHLTKQKIEILAVMDGYILNENTAVVHNTDQIEGFINVFNRDKLNSAFINHLSINIECQIETTKQGVATEENAVITFYNESKSVDHEIIPFDVQIAKSSIDCSLDRKLELIILSNVAQKYEISIKSTTSESRYFFEVITRPGQVFINIPVPILYHELQSQNSKNEYELYWTKFEGFDFQKFMNRKFIKIPNTKIKISNNLALLAQKNLDPVGNHMQHNSFVLSDRYYVPTYREFSAFGSEYKYQIRDKKLSFFMHEAQNMQRANIRTFQIDDTDTFETRKVLRQHQLASTINNFGVSHQKGFLQSFAQSYSQPSQVITPFASNKIERPASGGGGCGCGRKQSTTQPLKTVGFAPQ